MNYNKRLTTALVLSLSVHIPILALAALHRVEIDLDRIQLAEPIVLDLTPPEEHRTRRLIEANQPAEDLPRDTDLISNEASEARDEVEAAVEDSQPAVDLVDEFDELGAMPSPPIIVPPAEPAVVPPAEHSEKTLETQPEAAPAEEDSPEEPETEPAPAAPKSDATPVELPEISSDSFQQAEAVEHEETAAPRESTPEDIEEAAEPATEPLPERFDVAQNTLPTPAETIGQTRGREAQSAEVVGPLSFEANKHALGEYMLSVRRQVERTWRTSLQFKYSGTQQASATLECAIQPDGQLAHVKIIDRGQSMIYAALCKQAIERAAPFGPFPFEVPEAYRSENLVIRWKFSFM